MMRSRHNRLGKRRPKKAWEASPDAESTLSGQVRLWPGGFHRGPETAPTEAVWHSWEEAERPAGRQDWMLDPRLCREQGSRRAMQVAQVHAVAEVVFAGLRVF
jgi:hypothetical protein